MIKVRYSKYFILFSTLTFLGVFIFVVQKGYERLMQPINEAKNSSLTKPINPQLDINTLQLIENRPEFPEDGQVPIINTELSETISPP